MSITLPEPLTKFIQEKVQSGEFASADEAICQAVQLWHDQQHVDDRHADAITAGLADLERGDYSDYDAQELRELFGTLSERAAQQSRG